MSDREKETNQNNIQSPDTGDNFKIFFKVLSHSDGDDMIIDSALDAYSPQISVLETKGKDLLETIGDGAKRLFDKDNAFGPDYLNPSNTTPTTTNEAIEHQIKKKSDSAANAVFRPDVPSVEKKSSFFKGVKYDVSVDEFSAMKKISPTVQAGAVVDYFDKSVGLKYKKTTPGGFTTFRGEVEYEPFDSTVQVYTRYDVPMNSVSARLYLNENNPGISAGYSKQINKKSDFSANASWFKSDAAFEANYRTKLKDDSYLSVGAYGSTHYKEAGVRLSWNFYGF